MSRLAGLPVGIVMCSRVNRETDKNREGEEAAPTSCYIKKEATSGPTSLQRDKKRLLRAEALC